MLKRQRPATPPPIPSVPLEPSPLDTAIMEREYKRRRTTSSTPSDNSWKFASASRPITYQADNIREDGKVPCLDNEYKAANNILRELHTLHQHRLLFSMPSTLPTHYSASLQPKTDISSSLESSRRSGNSFVETDPEQSPSLDEQLQVKERYEETNRLLGSMFLTRRRQLGVYPQ